VSSPSPQENLPTEGQQHIYAGGIGRPGSFRWRMEQLPWFFGSVLFFFLGTCGDIAGTETFPQKTRVRAVLDSASMFFILHHMRASTALVLGSFWSNPSTSTSLPLASYPPADVHPASGIDTFAEATEHNEALSVWIDIFACASWVVSAACGVILVYFDLEARTLFNAPVCYCNVGPYPSL
jgi:succinate dehydrogenase hydrophobic anchor subunit